MITNGGIKTTIEMRSSLSWGVTRRILIDTDISGQSIVSSSRGMQSKMGAIRCPETSVVTNLCYVKYQKSEDLIYAAAEARW